MPDIQDLSPGQILADASVADFISRLGLGIAEAQRALDENSINQLGEFLQPRDGLGGKSLIQLGLMPAFYHYQHADLSCSLQLSMKVANSTSVGVGLNFGLNNASNNSSSSNNAQSSSESGSSSSHSTRNAALTVKTSTTGALTVNGQNFALSGGNPLDRINALADALRANAASGVQRVAVTPPSQAVNPQVQPPHAKVVASSNAVAFMNNGSASAIIEIEAVPASPETFVLNNQHQVVSVLQPSLQAYADDVASRIRTLGYQAVVWGPGSTLAEIHFDHDHSDIRAQDAPTLKRAADFLKTTQETARIESWCDRTGPSDYNRNSLGQRRIRDTTRYLTDQGVAAAQVNSGSVSHGEDPWQGLPPPENNEAHRMAKVLLGNTAKRYILVTGDAGHVMSGVSPDHTQANPPGNGNGFIFLGGTQAEDLTGGGRKVVIRGVDFPLNGAAVGGHAAHSGEAYAQHLADDVNAHAGVQVKAWATGHICHLALAGDNFALELVTTDSREISLSGSDDVTVTQQFSRSSSSNQSQTSSGNTTVAVGASIDLRFSRQFEQSVTGNSAISARLVAIPAPPEFLALVKEFLKE